MEQRMVTLDKALSPHYAENGSLILEAYALYFDNVSKQCIAQLKLRNIGQKTINAVVVELCCFDTFNHKVDSISYHYTRLTAKKNCVFGDKNAIALQSDKVSKFSVSLKAVSYADETAWESNEPKEFYLLPAPIPHSLEGELLEQYQRDLVQQGIHTTVCNQTQQSANLWQCVCGSWQPENEACLACGSKQNDLLEAANVSSLELHLKEYHAEQERLKEEARLARQREQEEAQRKEQQRQENELRAAAIRKKQNQRRMIICVVAAFAVAVVLLMTQVIIPSRKYDSATELMAMGKYEEAIDVFTNLQDFSDSPEKIQICWYNIGKTYMDKGMYEEAAYAYEAAGDYSDSILQSNASWYAEGRKLASNEQWRAATYAFNKADKYADSHKQLISAYQHLSEGLFFQNSVETNVYGLKSDGRLLATGGEKYGNDDGQRNVGHFADISNLIPLDFTTVGITSSGTLVAEGRDSEVFSSGEGWFDPASILYYEDTIIGLNHDGSIIATGDVANTVQQWTDIMYLLKGDYSLFGLTTDGNVRFVDGSYPSNGFANIKQWKNIKSLAVANGLTDSAAFGLKEDGTVVISGNDAEEYTEATTWADIQRLAYGDEILLGLKNDGTVVIAGRLADKYNVSDWSDVRSVYSTTNCVWGIRVDGTVLTDYEYGTPYRPRAIEEWRDIVALDFYGYYDEVVIGTQIDGTKRIAFIDSTKVYKERGELTNVEAMAVSDGLVLGLKADGTVVSITDGFSMLDYYAKNHRKQTPISEWSDIVKVYAFKESAFGIKADGTVVAAGADVEFNDIDITGWKLW